MKRSAAAACLMLVLAGLVFNIGGSYTESIIDMARGNSFYLLAIILLLVHKGV